MNPSRDHVVVQFSRGFTLIELLVVISIVALLVSLMIPALSSARGAAVAMQCLSRQRQMGMAIATYRADHEGLYPYANRWTDQDGNSMGKTGQFLYQLNDYIAPWDDLSTSAGMLSRDNSPQKNLLLCPATPHEVGSTSAPRIRQYAAISNGWRVHNYQVSAFFGYAQWDISGGSGWVWELFGRGQKRAILEDHSKVPMVGTARSDRWTYLWPHNNMPGFGGFFHPGSTTNILFADGHAKTVGNAEEVKAKVQNDVFVVWPEFR